MAYGHFRPITVDHTKVSTNDQANFVLTFAGTYSYLATVANGGDVTSASGYDIIFTSDAGGLTLLDFEIDTYTATSGKVAFHVRIPSLSHTVDTVIYLWYGDSGVTTSQENKAGVWPASRYGEVYHFGNASSFVGTDSSTIGSTLTGQGGATGVTSGKIGGAASFTPNAIGVSIAGVGSPAGTNLRTTSCWFKLNSSSPTGYQMLFGYGNWSFSGGTWDIFYSQADAGIIMVLGGLNQPWPWTPDTNWHKITAVMNAANSANVQLYMDGVAMTSSGLGSLSLNTIIGAASISVGGASQPANYYLDGLIDEARNEVGAKPVDWILTEYRNQNDPATFYSIGPDSSITGTGAIAARVPAITATGSLTPMGTGNNTQPVPVISGAGEIAIGGTGNITARVPNILASAFLSPNGTGTFIERVPVITGSGSVVMPIVGGSPVGNIVATLDLRGRLLAGPVPIAYIVSIDRYSGVVTPNDYVEDLGLNKT